MMDTRQTMPIILTVPTFEDFRGYLAVPYDKSINFNVRQINQGYSKKEFTLRGLHFQEGEHAQAAIAAECISLPFVTRRFKKRELQALSENAEITLPSDTDQA